MEATAQQILRAHFPMLTEDMSLNLIRYLGTQPTHQALWAFVPQQFPEFEPWTINRLYHFSLPMLRDTSQLHYHNRVGYRVDDRGFWTCTVAGKQSWGPCTQAQLKALPNNLEYQEQAYQYQLRSQNLYRCSLSGECERDLDGISLETCQNTCQGSPTKEVTYLALSYDPLQALDFPYSDQAQVVFRLTGKRVPPLAARQILTALAEDDWNKLRDLPELDAYLRERYDGLEIFLRDFLTLLNIVNMKMIHFAEIRKEVLEILRLHVPGLPARIAEDDNGLYFNLVSDLNSIWLSESYQLDNDDLQIDLQELISQHLEVLRRLIQ